MALQVNLSQAVYALSDALDLVGVDDVAHGKRVGIMAAECGKALGWSSADNHDLFELGMLHDIGVSSTQTHQHLLSEFDWVGSQHHTVVGHDLLRVFAPLAHLALPVRYHHTQWPDLVALDLPPAVAQRANLIYLVDRVDTLCAPYQNDHTVLLHAASIRAEIEARSGTHFQPELVAAFMQASRTEAFWLLLEPRAIARTLIEQLAMSPRRLATGQEILQLARLFARIVDAKSPYTAQHSQGVADVARLLAERMDIAPEACDKLEIAGLLHDLGKLRVPDEILDKAAPLDERERKIMNAHSFETYQILCGIEGFEEVAAWAAYHHEEPGGSGYPFHLLGENLAMEARILRVADIFQAMVQDRPYRAGLSGPQAVDFLRQLADRQRVEPSVCDALEDCADEAWALARPH